MSTNPERFYLDVVTPGGIIRDPDGLELPSLEDARAVALLDARDISGSSIHICNEARQTLLVVPFRDAIKVIE